MTQLRLILELVILAALGLAFIIFFIGSLYWVYSDAKRRGKSGWFITLIILFTWPIGFPVWLFFQLSPTMRALAVPGGDEIILS